MMYFGNLSLRISLICLVFWCVIIIFYKDYKYFENIVICLEVFLFIKYMVYKFDVFFFKYFFEV